MKNKKREMKEEYKQAPPPMGVFQIRNLGNEKVLVVAAINLQGGINRHQFQLRMGGHGNAQLQVEWNEFGSEKFVFEVLDEIKPSDDPAHDNRADLAFLEDFWLDKLQPYGDRGYNEKKMGSEERLRMIARNQAQSRDDSDDSLSS